MRRNPGRRRRQAVRVRKFGRRRLALVIATLVSLLSPAATTHAEGVAKRGEEIAVKHCARCHVIGERNRYGGIDSTPSFPLLVRRDDYRERFQTFYERRPHPVFVRMQGVARWSDALPNAKPFELVPEDIDDILAFIETLREK